MTEIIDHKAEAEAFDVAAHSVMRVGEEPPEALATLSLKEATLYLAEQQRIASLIALGLVVAGDGSRPFRHLVMRAANEFDVEPVPEIKKALGLS